MNLRLIPASNKLDCDWYVPILLCTFQPRLPILFATYITFKSLSGFFLQDDHQAIPSQVGAVSTYPLGVSPEPRNQTPQLPTSFGLIDDAPDRWHQFKRRISELNASAAPGVSYKVFFLGRHGQGYHNVAESKYGTEAWDDYYSKLYGDEEMTWGPDPLLTPLGHVQAADAHQAWLAEIPHGIPQPERHYVSPLKRALDTWAVTFGVRGISEDEGAFSSEKRIALVMEHCREEYGVHTCDLRSPLSHLGTLYPPPTFAFERGFAEEDPLWDADTRETKAHIVLRALSVLDTTFNDPGICE
ncbi:hypothetical protein PHLCEN_2v216 [Hermanssonia centrifuga]|uniref:Phosphoglycerate mutase n=1 Tax=Hermanssonia centrifuga TaxID=98765 RepID=A0A2R6S6Z5_9APHY|nr:hypothetical protein PHLCEN_2v216 [Hermanssonia centrifuga]